MRPDAQSNDWANPSGGTLHKTQRFAVRLWAAKEKPEIAGKPKNNKLFLCP